MNDEKKQLADQLRHRQVEKLANLPILKVRLISPTIDEMYRRTIIKQVLKDIHGEYEVFCSICGDTTEQCPLFRVEENKPISVVILLSSTIICKDCVTICLLYTSPSPRD